MAFDESKDKTIAEWRHGVGDCLVVSVRQYSGGDRKLQIGPREAVKVDGSITHRKAGRVSAEEWEWMERIAVEIGKALAG